MRCYLKIILQYVTFTAAHFLLASAQLLLVEHTKPLLAFKVSAYLNH
jgi:hypothetical protein